MQIAISVQFAYKSHYPRNANRCYHRTFTLSIKESAWNIYDKRPPSSVQRDGRDYSLGCEEGVDSPQWTAHSATIRETVRDCRRQSRDSQKNCQGQSRNSSSDQPVLVSIPSTSDCLSPAYPWWGRRHSGPALSETSTRWRGLASRHPSLVVEGEKR